MQLICKPSPITIPSHLISNPNSLSSSTISPTIIPPKHTLSPPPFFPTIPIQFLLPIPIITIKNKINPTNLRNSLLIRMRARRISRYGPRCNGSSRPSRATP